MIGRAARLLTLSVVLAAGLGAAASCEPARVAPAARSFQLGQLQFTALRDADNVVANDGSVFGLGVPPAQVAQVLKAAGQPTDKITLGVDALLVRSPGRVMLFDTGLGPKVHGVLIASLAQAGVAPAQVTDVFVTHSHGDHVGGLAAPDGRLAFPNATIHMSAREWAFMQSGAGAATLVKLIAPKVKPFAPGTTVVPGVTAVALYGHTPGHVGYEIASGGQTLIDAGDIAHSSVVSLARPDWRIAYDDDRVAGVATRRAELARLAASHEWVFAPHFPFPGVGKIQAAGQGFVWRPGTP